MIFKLSVDFFFFFVNTLKSNCILKTEIERYVMATAGSKVTGWRGVGRDKRKSPIGTEGAQELISHAASGCPLSSCHCVLTHLPFSSPCCTDITLCRSVMCAGSLGRTAAVCAVLTAPLPHSGVLSVLPAEQLGTCGSVSLGPGSVGFCTQMIGFALHSHLSDSPDLKVYKINMCCSQVYYVFFAM